MKSLRCLQLVVGLILSVFATTQVSANPSIDNSFQLDQQTKITLQAIIDGDWTTAANTAKLLNKRFPDYALGQLLFAETLRVTAGLPLQHVAEKNYSTNYLGLLLEAQARAAQPSTINVSKSDSQIDLNLQPAAIVRAGSNVDHVIMVDLTGSYLMLYDTTGEQPRLIKRHYIASGLGGFDKFVEGDLKTPVGVYSIHGFRSDGSLPTLYGSGALMLDYPNALDKLQRRTGSGIWLHGVPHKQKSRAPRSSEGCVTMSNDYLLELHSAINLAKTQVILADNIKWVEPKQAINNALDKTKLYEQYRKAWAQPSDQTLKSLYSDSAWQLAKVRIGTAANSLATAPDSLSIIEIPGNGNNQYLKMSFSSNEKTETQTTLYWHQTAEGQWQIVSETTENSNV